MASSHPNGELIEDREIAKLDEDRLGHSDVVAQLAQLVTSVPTPSNVALYGAWGSGKSGVGRLLEEALRQRSDVRFARFDAFKYAQNPLRRNFVSVVASALNQRASKYHEDLYRGRVDTDFHVPFTKLAKLLWIFALVAFVCTSVVLVVVAASTVVQGRDAWAAILTMFSSAVPASLVPATLLTAVIALVGKTFVQEQRVDRADSDEEFESLFRQLVKDSGAKRLVVFVDEIDRCAPEEVVQTLDAVRTFLGVEKCVFVVAADPQVIEQALADGTTHATPADELNPYYSAGSGYLDKVFQYQVTLPPLMPQSVTSFAVSLVRDRPGLWQTIDTSVVASILIPTHVRSPRRVKNLLNSFAMAYRLAEARNASGMLDIDVAHEVDELARIVCLRVEFPLFARDMVSDPSLPDYVLRLSEEPNDDVGRERVWDEYPYVSEQTRRIAEGYAGLERQVDRLLLDPPDSEQEEVTAKSVTAVHGQQLLDYLSRTQLVTGPTKALIHLQNTGPLFGLPSTVAEQLERDAQNGALPAIRTLFGGLPESARASALDLLVQQARGAIGYESRNVARAILAAIESSGSPAEALEPCVLVVGQLVTKYPDVLDQNTAIGAWALALASDRAEARTLGVDVLSSDIAETDDELFAMILRQSAAAMRIDAARYGEILTSRLLTDDPAIPLDVLGELSDADLAAALMTLQNELPAQLALAIDTRAAWEKRRKDEEQPAAAASTTAATVRRSSAATTSPADDENPLDDGPPTDPALLLDGLASLATRLDKPEAQHLVGLLLEVDRQATRDRVQGLLGGLTPIDDAQVAVQILRATAVRPLGQWPAWLRAVSPEQLSSPQGSAGIHALVEGLQEHARASAKRDYDITAAAEAIEPLLAALGEPELAEVGATAADVGDPVSDDDDIEVHDRRLVVAMLLADAGLCTRDEVLTDEGRSVAATLEAELDKQELAAPLAQYVIDGIKRVLTGSVDSEVEIRLLAAIAQCVWLSEFDHAHALAAASALAHVDAAQHDVTPPRAATVLSYKADMTADSYLDLVQYWLMSTDEELADVRPVIDPLIRTSSVPISLLDALRRWRTRSGELEQRALLASYLDDSTRPSLSDRVLIAIGLRDLPDQSVADILTARYKSARTNPKRLEVLHLWDLAELKDSTARTALIRDVLIPVFRQGVTAVDPALGYLQRLAYPIPRQLRKPLGVAVVEGARGRERLEERATTLLEQLGYRVKRGGIFGLRREIDTDA